MRIAVLNSETSQNEFICRAMINVGHNCHGFTDGKKLLRELSKESFDLLILDWILPDCTGVSVVKWIRQVLVSAMPILFFTTHNEEADIVEGLAIGADHFMVKTTHAGELEARVFALLRRAYPKQHEISIECGAYFLYLPARAISINGQFIKLTAIEYHLALILFQNMGRLLSLEYLREAVWGRGIEKSSRSIDIHISRLRTKLEFKEVNKVVLSAVYGKGYRLVNIDVIVLNSASTSTGFNA